MDDRKVVVGGRGGRERERERGREREERGRIKPARVMGASLERMLARPPTLAVRKMCVTLTKIFLVVGMMVPKISPPSS